MDTLGIPPEIIAQVFTYLDDADVFAARASNRALERASFSHFGTRFFRKRGFMITTPSLRVLRQIADHAELRRYLQHVWFNPDCYTFVEPACNGMAFIPGKEIQVTPSSELLEVRRELQKRGRAYQDCKQDHQNLLATDALERTLAAVFALLPNLKTVGMRRSEAYSPYGWRKLASLVGEDPRILGSIPKDLSQRTLSAPTHLYIAIVGALASTTVKLERLYTDAVEIDNISERLLPQSIMDAACSSIHYLEVNAIKASMGYQAHPEHPRDIPSGRPRNRCDFTSPSASDYGCGLSRLLKATPLLKELGLQIFPDRKQSHLVAPSARNPESWRESYPHLALQHTVQQIHLPQLSRLKLEKLTTTSTVLRSLFSPCASNLTSLKFRDIRLLSSEEDPRPWQTIFSFLHGKCLGLDYILFYHLMYDRGGVSYVEEPPAALPADTQEYLVEHVPASHGGQALFANYEHITLEVRGREQVREKLEEVMVRHWYHKPLFSYSMDDELWHTDTSDEDW